MGNEQFAKWCLNEAGTGTPGRGGRCYPLAREEGWQVTGVWLGPAFLPLRTALGRDGADAEQPDGDIFVPGASRAVTRVS